MGRRVWEKSEPPLVQEVRADSLRMRRENSISKLQPKSKEKRENGKGKDNIKKPLFSLEVARIITKRLKHN